MSLLELDGADQGIDIHAAGIGNTQCARQSLNLFQPHDASPMASNRTDGHRSGKGSLGVKSTQHNTYKLVRRIPQRKNESLRCLRQVIDISGIHGLAGCGENNRAGGWFGPVFERIMISDMHIRPAAVAGTFYPADASALTRAVDAMMADARLPPALRPSPIVIAPHAGYIYSGPTAAHAYMALPPGIQRVAVLGPAHRVPVRGLALPDCDAFETPLGRVPLDRALCDALKQLPGITVNDDVHRHEHALEVHLPFLQRRLGAFALIPLAVGDAMAAMVGVIIDRLRQENDLAIVISSDLSHYHDYETACRLDMRTVDDILAGRTLADYRQACGAAPINGLLRSLRAAPLDPRLLDLCNSGDTSGDKDRVVGYAAIAFQEHADA